MTKAKKIKLVKVMDDLYRSEDGEILIVKDTFTRTGRDPWVIRWKDGIGCRKEKRCKTLAECRKALESI